MSRYKRVASGPNFVVDYPADYWNRLTSEEQHEIAQFYNSTYGKTAAKHGRPSGAIGGRYPSSVC